MLITDPGASDAESYWTIEQINAYAVKLGKSFPITGADAIAAAEAAARRATAWIDGTYRMRFTGAPTDVWQALEWPRAGVMFRGEQLPEDEIPGQIGKATAEAAIRELATPGVLSPDPAQRIVREKIGELETQYSDKGEALTAPVLPTEIEGILAPLLGGQDSNLLVGGVQRA